MSARRFITPASRGTIATRVCSPGRCASTIPAGFTPTNRRAREKKITPRSNSFPEASLTVAESWAVSPTSSVSSGGSTTSSAGSWANAAPARSGAARASAAAGTVKPRARRSGEPPAGRERRPAERIGGAKCSMIGRTLLMSPAQRGTGNSIPPGPRGGPGRARAEGAPGGAGGSNRRQPARRRVAGGSRGRYQMSPSVKPSGKGSEGSSE